MKRHMQSVLRRAIGLPSWPAGGLVLLYHRIAQPASDPQCLAVSPEHFAGHLDHICERGVPMTIEAMLVLAHRSALPRGAVAITFDDGYADTLHAAVPLLARAQVPATVFVTTGTLTNGRGFWWDELEQWLLQPGSLPARLQLRIGDEGAEWDLSGACEWTDRDCARYASWTVEHAESPTPRHRAYRDLCHQLRRVAPEVRDRTLDELSVLARTTRLARPTHRPLRLDELTALAQTPQITIGSHTASHSSLAFLTPDEQRREVVSAKRQLEQLTGTSVSTLAYPFGGPLDLSGRTAAIAQEAGVTLACTTEPGSVRRDTDSYRVPRVVVRNGSRAEFRRCWSKWTAA